MQFAKAFGAVALSGAAAILVLKLLAAVVVPLLGALVGFVALAFKVGLFLVVGFVVYRVFKRRRDAAA